MAVGYDFVAQATNSNSATLTWAHNTASSPRGVLVFTFVLADADDATAVTYGGVTVNAVSGGRASDAGFGDCKAWFLGSGIPTGNQNVVVTRTNNANVIYGVSITFSAAADTSVTGVTLDTADIITFAEVNVTGADGCLCIGATQNGFNEINAITTPKFNPPNILAGASSVWINGSANNTGSSPGTAGKEGIYDFNANNRVCGVVRKTATGSGNVGFAGTNVTSVPPAVNQASVYLAVIESATTAPQPPFYSQINRVGVPINQILIPRNPFIPFAP